MRPCRWISCLWLAGFTAVCAPAGWAQSPGRAADAPAYGTSSRIQHHVGFAEFETSRSSDGFDQTFGPGYFGRVLLSSGSLWAHPHLPSGARLASFELDYCDTHPTLHMALILFDCDFLGGDCHTLGTINTGSGVPGCGFLTQDLTVTPYTMQNNSRQLILEAALGSGSSQNVLLGAYVGYTLQVSAAPATATFSDVPTTSPQFKFVEALVSAGITAGCASGSYCPDAPISRGQMAVFLAAALGLHFPN